MPTRRPGRRVFAVGHFPPPIHGLSVGTERFAAALERAAGPGLVTRLDISGERHGRSARHHLVRIARTLRTVAALVRRGRRGDALYLACDAGPGMLYTIAVLLTARAIGMERWAHHHSYAYLTRPSRLMALVVRVGGGSTTHIVTCADQAELLVRLYGVRRTTVLPIVYVLDEPGPAPDRPPPGGRPIVLGHLSNLTAEKGLQRAAETLAELVARGVDAELALAGPSPTPEDRAVLDSVLTADPERTSHVGAVFGAAKDAFLDGIDVFLFPTRYRNESFGIVVAEAMAHGVPVIAYRAGCLEAGWVGGAGTVLDPAGPFAGPAADLVERWTRDPAAFSALRAAAHDRAVAAQHEGTEVAEALAREIAGVGRG